MADKSYYADITCKVVGVKLSEFEKEASQIATALFSLAGYEGSRFAWDPRDMTITFGVMIEAANKRVALKEAMGVVQSALQVADGGTPQVKDEEWPEDFPTVRKIIRTEIELVAA